MAAATACTIDTNGVAPSCRSSDLEHALYHLSLLGYELISLFVTFCDIVLGPCASRSVLAEACGLGVAWAMVRSIYVAKFSFLSGRGSKISENYIFCDT